MSALPKMAGVFEVEVDGVEHDHGHRHDDEVAQVTTAPRFLLSRTPFFKGRDARCAARFELLRGNGAKC